MTTAILLSTDGEWTERLRRAVGRRIDVLELDLELVSDEELGVLPADMVLLELAYVTDRAIASLQQIKAARPSCLTVCVAPESLARRARSNRDLDPDFWIIVPATDLQLQMQLEPILALLGSDRTPASNGAPVRPGNGAPTLLTIASYSAPRLESSLCRMIGRMTGSRDSDFLLSAYCDAVQEMVRCVSYCLLWQQPNADNYQVICAEGIAPALRQMLRLRPTDPLPCWLRQTRGVLFRDVLAEASDSAQVLKELEICGGVLAVPLFCEGTLRGIMVVGPKAVGTAYELGEAEALFVLSTSTATAVRQAELHRELEARNAYIAQVLSTMESGLVTVSQDERIQVCNPYAARILRSDGSTLVGRDIRTLPAPLGDYLYSCLKFGEERSREVIEILGGRAALRVSTRRLLDPDGQTMGSMMLVEDITAERNLAQERRKAERDEIINQVVARFAHELKNPLATIHTFAELLPTAIDDPEFRQYWSDHVMRDVHRLDDLVAKLVSLAEQPDSHRQPVKVPELLRLALARLSQLDEQASEHVTAQVPDSLPGVNVDSGIVAAAIAHLVRYGLSHDHRPVAVTAETSNGIVDSKQVTILIHTRATDTAGDDALRLLDPAYVLDHPDVDLGPSASQRLVESQGGSLVASHATDGTVFRISLTAVAHDETGAG